MLKLYLKALRRRHHTVSSTQSQSNAIEEAKKMNSVRDKQRCQTIDNSASVSSSIFQVIPKHTHAAFFTGVMVFTNKIFTTSDLVNHKSWLTSDF